MEDFTKVTVRHYRFERCDMLEDIAYLKEKEIAFWQVLQPDEVRQALAKDEQVDVESILDNQPENPQDDGWAALLEGLRANDNPALEPTGQPGQQGGIMKSGAAEDVIAKDVIAEDGGEGSGNFNHEGRPGKVGGSGEGGGSSSKSESKEKPKESQRERSSNRKKEEQNKQGEQPSQQQGTSENSQPKQAEGSSERGQRESAPQPAKSRKLPSDSMPTKNYITSDGRLDVQKLQDDYQTFTQQMDAPCQAYLQTMMQAVEFKSAKLSEDAPFGYSPSKDAFYYDTSRKSFHDIDLSIVTTHELAHRIDNQFVNVAENENFRQKVSSSKQLIDNDPEKFQRFCQTDTEGFISDICSAVCEGQYDFYYDHPSQYWKQHGNKEKEIFANYYSLEAFKDTIALSFLKKISRIFTHFAKISKRNCMKGWSSMYVAAVDSAYMREHNVLELKIEYRKRFGEPFISFNYADFDRVGDKCAAQIYTEELERCLREGKPTSIISKWCQPGSLIDH